MNGTGGDSNNEGIFHSQSKTFVIQTAQYQVWAQDTVTHQFTDSLGNFPPNSLMGVNFTVFGRFDSVFSSVEKQTPPSSTILNVQVGPRAANLTAYFFTKDGAQDANIEIFDMLGRRVVNNPEGYVEPGWNQRQLSISSLPSGVYTCKLSGSSISATKKFAIVR